MITRRVWSMAPAMALFGALAFADGVDAASPENVDSPPTLEIDDATPGQIRITWTGFVGGGSVNGGPATVDGFALVGGETATFTGQWNTQFSAVDNAGILHFVDPGQPNLARTRIDGVWTPFSNSPSITLTVTSTPFGDDLGALPAYLIAPALPMSDSPVGISAEFVDPVSGIPVAVPGSLDIIYVGDLQPECDEPVAYVQSPQFGGDASYSDLDPANGLNTFETADNLLFAQDTMMGSLRWWGQYAGLADTVQVDADDFTLYLYEDNGGQPADDPTLVVPLPQAVRAGVGETASGGRPVFVYAATLPAPVAFRGGVTYWISIVNNTVADAQDNWLWLESNDGASGAAARPLNPAGDWFFPPFHNLSLELCGPSNVAVCPTDFDGNGLTDGADLAALLANWGPCDPPPPLLTPMEPAEPTLRREMRTSVISTGASAR